MPLQLVFYANMQCFAKPTRSFVVCWTLTGSLLDEFNKHDLYGHVIHFEPDYIPKMALSIFLRPSLTDFYFEINADYQKYTNKKRNKLSLTSRILSFGTYSTHFYNTVYCVEKFKEQNPSEITLKFEFEIVDSNDMPPIACEYPISTPINKFSYLASNEFKNMAPDNRYFELDSVVACILRKNSSVTLLIELHEAKTIFCHVVCTNEYETKKIQGTIKRRLLPGTHTIMLLDNISDRYYEISWPTNILRGNFVLGVIKDAPI